MKARITLTAVVEYKINPELFVTNQYEEMLALDIQQIKGCPSYIVCDNNAKVTVTGELVKERTKKHGKSK